MSYGTIYYCYWLTEELDFKNWGLYTDSTDAFCWKTFLSCSGQVLDEADRLLEQGCTDFTKDLEVILAAVPPSRQTLLFSATLTDTLNELKKIAMNKPFFWESKSEWVCLWSSTICKVYPVENWMKPAIQIPIGNPQAAYGGNRPPLLVCSQDLVFRDELPLYITNEASTLNHTNCWMSQPMNVCVVQHPLINIVQLGDSRKLTKQFVKSTKTIPVSCSPELVIQNYSLLTKGHS